MAEAITILTLPPYSPELNPAETIWQSLRQNELANRLYASDEAMVEACCDAWNSFAQAPDLIRSIAGRDWAKVSGILAVRIMSRKTSFRYPTCPD